KPPGVRREVRGDVAKGYLGLHRRSGHLASLQPVYRFAGADRRKRPVHERRASHPLRCGLPLDRPWWKAYSRNVVTHPRDRPTSPDTALVVGRELLRAAGTAGHL